MPKVVHLTSVHPADDVRIASKECETLAVAGFDVSLVATYAMNESLAPGKFDVMTVSPVHSRLARMSVLARRVVHAAARLEADVYHLHDPELLPFVGALRPRGAVVIYDAHEDLPLQMLHKEWLPPRLRHSVGLGARRLMPLLLRRVDAVVAAGPRVAERVPHPRVTTVRNYPIRREGTPTANSRRPHAVYVGSISAARGALELAEAVRLLNRADSGIALAGQCWPRDLRPKLTASGLTLLGWQDPKAVSRLLDESSVDLATLLPYPQYVDSLPTKLFEYMAAGLPVVASDFPVWRQFIEETGSGLLVDPEKPAEIAAAIARLLDHPDEARELGERGRVIVERDYTWDAEGAALLALYDELLS